MPGQDPITRYLARVPEPFRDICAELDRVLRDLLPDAEPVISYAMPGYRVRGKVVAGWAAHREFCSYYPHSGSVLAELAAETEGRGQTKSALHFTPDDPLPRQLVARLVAVRLEQLEREAR